MLFFAEINGLDRSHSLLENAPESFVNAALLSVIDCGVKQGLHAVTNESPAADKLEEEVVSKKPRFVIHMGPMKTGTSSLYVLQTR